MTAVVGAITPLTLSPSWRDRSELKNVTSGSDFCRRRRRGGVVGLSVLVLVTVDVVLAVGVRIWDVIVFVFFFSFSKMKF